VKIPKKPLKKTLSQMISMQAATFLIADSASVYELPGNWAQAELDKASAPQAVA
jgi:hypothetical protein